jgi:hypothetical protein
MKKLNIQRNEKGICEHYAWPGGYPVFYLTGDNAVLCPNCVDKERELIDNADESDLQWLVVAYDVTTAQGLERSIVQSASIG